MSLLPTRAGGILPWAMQLVGCSSEQGYAFCPGFWIWVTVQLEAQVSHGLAASSEALVMGRDATCGITVFYILSAVSM